MKTVTLKMKKTMVGNYEYFEIKNGRKIFAKINPVRSGEAVGMFLVNIHGVGCYRESMESAKAWVIQSAEDRINLFGFENKVEIVEC